MGTREVRFCDLSGEEPAEPVTITYRGDLFELDLSETTVRIELGKLLDAARKVGGEPQPVTSNSAKRRARAREIEPVKVWAEQQGLWERPVKGGMLPYSVIEKYNEAHGTEVPVK